MCSFVVNYPFSLSASRAIKASSFTMNLSAFLTLIKPLRSNPLVVLFRAIQLKPIHYKLSALPFVLQPPVLH